MRCLFQVILSLTVLLHYISASELENVLDAKKEAFEELGE
jgi:hypothetical protein